MERYIQELLAQIRCKQAHELVRREIQTHIEEQVCENMANGMEREEAEEEAIRDMGDPVETGVEFDRIHRPRIEWKLVLTVVFISLCSVAIRYFVARDCQMYSNYSLIENILTVGIGLVLMGVIYRLDYSIIGHYAKVIGAVFCIGFLMIIFSATVVNGSRMYIHLGPVMISPILLLYLYVPVYGAILFQYRNCGKNGFWKSILWVVIPVCLAYLVSNGSQAVVMGVTLSILLSIAVWKGWFPVSRKKFLICYWMILFFIPLLAFGLSVNVPFLAKGFNMETQTYVEYFSGETYGVRDLMKKILSESAWVGRTNLKNLRPLPSAIHTHILVSIAAYYGSLAAAFVVGGLVLITGKIFSVSKHQKNQLGKMMGYGCGLVFFNMIFSNVAMNMGVTATLYGDLPFLSASGSTMLISYTFIGMVLSIYRYQNILSAIPKKRKHFKIKMEKV